MHLSERRVSSNRLRSSLGKSEVSLRAFRANRAAFLEEAMKKILMVSGLMLSALLVYLHADTKRESKDQYQMSTVVSVNKHGSESNYVGGSPSDAPLQAEDYSYDIGIRLNCNIYIGRYESATDYLPSVFSPKHSVDVRLQKQIMYVSLPESDREVKMGIVAHSRVKEEGCAGNS